MPEPRSFSPGVVSTIAAGPGVHSVNGYVLSPVKDGPEAVAQYRWLRAGL